MALSSASNWYKMDGLDLYDTYGVIVTSGSDDFLALPKLKEPLTHDWRDESGTEVDLSNPVYEPRLATMKIWLIANSEEDFWSKYESFWTALSEAGTRSLEIMELGQTFDIFYRETITISRLTRIKYTSKVGVTMELRFEIMGGGFIGSGHGSYYWGPVDDFPTTWAGVLALGETKQEGSGNTFSLLTGTAKVKFCAAMRQEKSIKKVIDLDASNSNITPIYQVIRTINDPLGNTYKIYGMAQSLAYSLNHTHLITTQNS